MFFHIHQQFLTTLYTLFYLIMLHPSYLFFQSTILIENIIIENCCILFQLEVVDAKLKKKWLLVACSIFLMRWKTTNNCLFQACGFFWWFTIHKLANTSSIDFNLWWNGMDKPLLWSGYIYFYSNLAFINSNFQGDSAKPSDITITLIMAVKSVKKRWYSQKR